MYKSIVPDISSSAGAETWWHILYYCRLKIYFRITLTSRTAYAVFPINVKIHSSRIQHTRVSTPTIFFLNTV